MNDNSPHEEAVDILRRVLSPHRTLRLAVNEPLSRHTRFATGGPAALYIEARDPDVFLQALSSVRASCLPFLVIGGGTNLVAADVPFPGVVLRFLGERITVTGGDVEAEAGASLQAVVDFTIERGLEGIHTMTGIPGTIGAAIYGNAGAYGNSIGACVADVRIHDGRRVRLLDQARCEFRYRESVFKRRKDWIILSARLRLKNSAAEPLAQRAAEILQLRNAKYPPEMLCAGSIFKNLLFDELPPEAAARVPPALIREGKVPAAWFLEQVGAKGESRGDIHVAAYHANLIYNGGAGTGEDLRALIEELKQRVHGEFGLRLEEEVQYVGFER